MAAHPVAVAGQDVPTHLPASVVAVGLVVGVLAVSTAAVLVRVADAPPLALAFYRCAGGAVALAPFAVRSRLRSGGAQRLPYGLLGVSGVFLALHFGLWISSLSYTTVASSVVLLTMAPLFVAVGGALALAEHPSRRTWVGGALAVVGAVGVSLADAGGVALGRQALLGNAMAFGGALTVAGYLVIGRMARRRLPVVVYATVVYGVAAGLLLLVCLATGTPLLGFDATAWLAIAGLVVGPQLLGHTVFNTLLSTVTASVVAVVVLAEPVSATLLAWLVLSELPAPGFWLAAPLILVGVAVSISRPRAGGSSEEGPTGGSPRGR